MQVNVNAENVISSLVTNFGDGGAVSTCDGGIIKLQVKALHNGDILTISNLLQWSDIQVKRSGTGLLILFIPKPWSGEYSEELLKQIESINADIDFNIPPYAIKQLRVRDFYEALPQDARMAAFNNTAKNKWDMEVDSLSDAILRSFYISHSPEGTEYWQDVILEHSGKEDVFNTLAGIIR